MIIAIFLGFNQCVEVTSTALTDDFPHSRVRPYPGEFFFIPLLQRFLIFIFPVTVPHGIFPSFHRTGAGQKYLTHPILCLYGFCLLSLSPLLPVPHFTVRFPLASLTAVFHIASGRGEHFPAVSADTFTAPARRRFLAVKFRPAVRAAEQRIRPFRFKFFPTAFADQLERPADSVFAGLDLLVAFTALDSMPVQRGLPLFFLRCQLRGWEVKASDKLQIDVHLLRPVAVYLFRGVDDDPLDELVYREEEVHEQQGVGIGLYLAREIVTRQGGYIRVVSEPGRGSEFSIMLPTK